MNNQNTNKTVSEKRFFDLFGGTEMPIAVFAVMARSLYVMLSWHKSHFLFSGVEVKISLKHSLASGKLSQIVSMTMTPGLTSRELENLFRLEKYPDKRHRHLRLECWWHFSLSTHGFCLAPHRKTIFTWPHRIERKCCRFFWLSTHQPLSAFSSLDFPIVYWLDRFFPLQSRTRCRSFRFY